MMKRSNSGKRNAETESPNFYLLCECDKFLTSLSLRLLTQKMRINISISQGYFETFQIKPIANIQHVNVYMCVCQPSRVWLFATLQIVACQAPLSLGFPRQEYQSGLPFPSPVHESESAVTQLCPTLRSPMDCSLPGSFVHGIFQARILEWIALSSSRGSS